MKYLPLFLIVLIGCSKPSLADLKAKVDYERQKLADMPSADVYHERWELYKNQILTECQVTDWRGKEELLSPVDGSLDKLGEWLKTQPDVVLGKAARDAAEQSLKLFTDKKAEFKDELDKRYKDYQDAMDQAFAQQSKLKSAQKAMDEASN